MKLILLLILSFLGFQSPASSKVEKPKLILVISIDQFRADYLQKFAHLFLPASIDKNVGGFNYLIQKGAHFSHAEYGLLQNMTGPGHATILTGSYAHTNGIPNNDWYDTDSQKFIYCTEDQSKKTVGANPSSPNVGTSPKNLIGTTFGDELKNAYPESKVVSVALKDRSAILMGGHRSDLTIWFDLESFKWVSSEYYLSSNKLPVWLENINQSLQQKVGIEQVWNKKLDKQINQNSNVPDSKYIKDMGINFPHKAKIGSTSSLLFPMAIEMPVEVASKAIEEFKLGLGKSTDVLAISFSSHDYVGHHFGPESDEIKETTVLEDQVISKFLNVLNKKIPGGLNSVWVVLTADHGVSGNPRVLKENKIPAGLVNQEAINSEIEKFLTKKYGKGSANWLLAPSELNFYINQDIIREKDLDLTKVRDEAAKHIMTKKELLMDIAEVFSGTDVRRRTLPTEQHEKQILRTYFEGRSGDIMMIPKPYYVVEYGATTHLSGYSYDRYVPVVLAGKPFKSGLYAGGHVVDIAPTLAFLMGIIPPSNSEGEILEKALILK